MYVCMYAFNQNLQMVARNMFKQIWLVLLIGWNYWNKLQSFSFACLLQISLKLTSPELHPPEWAPLSEDKRRGALSSNYGLSTAIFILKHLHAVVQTLDSAIHRIKIYPMDSAIGFPNTYPLVSDLSAE